MLGFRQQNRRRKSIGSVMVRRAGIEPARLAVGDFELACEGVFVGKRGESERRFVWLKAIVNQYVRVIW